MGEEGSSAWLKERARRRLAPIDSERDRVDRTGAPSVSGGLGVAIGTGGIAERDGVVTDFWKDAMAR